MISPDVTRHRGVGLAGPAPLASSFAIEFVCRSVALLRRVGLTATLCALAVGVFVLPGNEAWLAYDRTALAGGEIWRVWTGHLVHWSPDHLLWDVAAFAVLGALCEMRSRRRFALALGASALAIPTLLWWGTPGMERYGGLSGLDSALFALLGAHLLAEQRQAGRVHAIVWAALLAAAFAVKIGFELVAGQPLFASDLGPGVVPVPLAHCAGALAGLLCALRAGDPRPPGSKERVDGEEGLGVVALEARRGAARR